MPTTIPPGAPGAPALRAAHWIENEGLLRDEGVLFGLTLPLDEHDPRELRHKLGAIDAHTRRAQARAESLRQELQVQLEAVAARRAEAERAHEAELLAPPALAPWPQHAVRMGIGVAAVVTVFVVVLELLRPIGLAEPVLVSLGVVLVGLSGHAARASALFTSDEARARVPDAAERWKAWATEAGLPLVMGLFVVLWAWGTRPGAQLVGGGLFVALALLVAGGQILSSVPTLWQTLRIDAESRREARRARADREARAAEAKAAHETLQEEEKRLRMELAKVATDEQLEALGEMRKQVFLSEVEFARNARRRFGDDIQEEVLADHQAYAHARGHAEAHGRASGGASRDEPAGAPEAIAGAAVAAPAPFGDGAPPAATTSAPHAADQP